MKTLMTKALCLILLASGASALLAQGGPSKCGTTDRKNTKLVVGSDFRGTLGYPTFEVRDVKTPEDDVIGFDASCACEIAHRIGFGGVEFRETALVNLLSVLTANPSPIDIAMSAISITQSAQSTPNVAFVKYNDDTLGIVFTKSFFNANIGANPGLGDPAQVLNVISAKGFPVVVTDGSRELGIVTSRGIKAAAFTTLTAAFNSLSINPGGTANILFVDGATAEALVTANPNTLVLVNNVVDTTNSVPSKGLGIAINSQCCQLYADIQKAVDDMNADGTLARLRAQFHVPTVFTPVTGLTPATCANTVAKINSNVIANYFFSKNCPCNVPVAPVTTR